MAKKSPTPTTTCDLSNVQKLALCKAKNIKVDDKERDRVKAGEYPVDFSVHVKGVVAVGEDCETSQVNKVDPYQLLLVACDKLNGVTVEALLKEADARANDPAFAAQAKEFGERAAVAAEAIRAKTKSPRKGAVTFNGTITSLDVTVTEDVQVP